MKVSLPRKQREKLRLKKQRGKGQSSFFESPDYQARYLSGRRKSNTL